MIVIVRESVRACHCILKGIARRNYERVLIRRLQSEGIALREGNDVIPGITGKRNIKILYPGRKGDTAGKGQIAARHLYVVIDTVKTVRAVDLARAVGSGRSAIHCSIIA